MNDQEAFNANRDLWNAMAEVHVRSAFYDVESFVAGRNSLTALELELLGDVVGKRLLHLQCHFGQDTLSLARMGAHVTGLDLSDVSIEKAKELADRCGLKADWIRANVLDLQPSLDNRYDIVFTSYGTIGWLPELTSWAKNISHYLKSGGRFIFVEFHPVIWMFDNEFKRIEHSYFNRKPIVEMQKGTYADINAPIEMEAHGWNHSLADVIGALLAAGLRLDRFMELDGSPHDCFTGTVKGSDGLHRINGFEGKLPMVYALICSKIT